MIKLLKSLTEFLDVKSIEINNGVISIMSEYFNKHLDEILEIINKHKYKITGIRIECYELNIYNKRDNYVFSFDKGNEIIINPQILDNIDHVILLNLLEAACFSYFDFIITDNEFMIVNNSTKIKYHVALISTISNQLRKLTKLQTLRYIFTY